MTEETEAAPVAMNASGQYVAQVAMTPTQDTKRKHVPAPAYNVVPVLFLPGIMGSNLKATKDVSLTDPSGGSKSLAKANDKVWNVDSSNSAAGWIFKNPAERQALLNKDVLTVDDRGKIDTGIDPDAATQGVVISSGKTMLSELPVEVVRKRGWGTVSWQFYGPFLDWLQYQLNQGKLENGQPNAVFRYLLGLKGQTPPGATKPPAALTEAQIRKVLNYHFPVYAAGYNWLQSNLLSGGDVLKVINGTVLPDAKQYGICGGQVILVTHSMGGLVGRAVAKQGGSAILGVIHGVQPLDGAAAFYKRLAAGFSDEGGGFFGWLQSLALGKTSKDTTPVIAHAPGPLELAPNKRYNDGKPWLLITDASGKKLKELPASGDPYAEIYNDTKSVWRMINPAWLNPAGNDQGDPFVAYDKVLDQAKNYHDQIGGYVHPQTYAHYSFDKSQKSWGTVAWMATPTNYDYVAPPAPGPTATWTFRSDLSGSTRAITDGSNDFLLTVQPQGDAGDGTVPAQASAAQIGPLSGCQIACAHNPGYEHSASYAQDKPQTETVRHTVLDAFVRLTEKLAPT